jgi:putative ABC transport system substrate-binding protein
MTAYSITLSARSSCELGTSMPIAFAVFRLNLATPMFSVDAAAFIAQVRALRLASVYQWPEDADDGALIAYGPRYAEMYRLRARLVMKVLRGTKPADIPVEQPTKFELVFNLKTAKAIGIDVPNSQLLRADKVIE